VLLAVRAVVLVPVCRVVVVAVLLLVFAWLSTVIGVPAGVSLKPVTGSQAGAVVLVLVVVVCCLVRCSAVTSS